MRKALISVSIVLLFVLGSEVRAAGGPTADVALNVTPPASMKVGTPSTWHGQLFAYFPSQDGTEDPVAAEINGGNRSFVAVDSATGQVVASGNFQPSSSFQFNFTPQTTGGVLTVTVTIVGGSIKPANGSPSPIRPNPKVLTVPVRYSASN